MKKKSNNRISRIFKRIINLRSWSDWDRMKSFTVYLVNGIFKFLVPQESTASESFAEAKKRLNLTDTAILAKQKGLLRLSLLMVSVAFCLFGYAIYQLVYGSYIGFILSLVVTSIAIVLAFRYHFWYFQIKEHKLGCTFHEWFRQGLMGDKR